MNTGRITAIHHLNCCTNMPRVGRFFNGKAPARVVSHTLLLETDGGLILVDTGIGMDDMKSPERLGPMHIINRPRLDENETALKQVQRLGFRPAEVRHIVMTHLDLDHTGGLPDFPGAAVHVLKSELEAAMRPKSRKEKERYRPAHWAHSPRWITHEENGADPWFGFSSIRNLQGLPRDIMLIPLPGHSRGHCGVVIYSSGRWLFHTGDTYYFHKQMQEKPETTPMVFLFQHLAHRDYREAMRTKHRVRDLALDHKNDITLFCSHDTEEFETLSGTQVE